MEPPWWLEWCGVCVANLLPKIIDLESFFERSPNVTQSEQSLDSKLSLWTRKKIKTEKHLSGSGA